MKIPNAAAMIGLAVMALPLCASETQPLTPPKAGKVEIMPLSEVKPGMKGTAWTVFQGNEPEPVPVEIIGRWKNQWGPKQDVILAKMGGKAVRTNVAGGMSGSPVYIDGKLVGAVALRISVFSPDAICGITPIELMLEINDFDQSRPEDARTPDKLVARSQRGRGSGRTAGAGGGGRSGRAWPRTAGTLLQTMLVPIEAPLVFSGFQESTLREFGPLFQQMGITAVQGGGGADIHTNKPAPGWEHALNPGEAVSGVLVDGDLDVTRPGHGDLQRRQARAGLRPLVLQSGAGGYADEPRAKC